MTYALPARRTTTTSAGRRAEGERRAGAEEAAGAVEPTRLPALLSPPDARCKQRKGDVAGDRSRTSLSNQRQPQSLRQQQHTASVGQARQSQPSARTKTKRAARCAINGSSASSHSLSPMDERILILYHSSLKRSWAAETLQLAHFQPKYEHEAVHAATQIQRIVRGRATRARLAAFDGPANQRAARHVQFAFRWLVVCQRIFRRVQTKKNARVLQIQKWYRGCRCRERLRDDQARLLVHRVILFQRHVRGHRFWRVVAALLHDRRCRAATAVQRLYRGWRGRELARAIRFEQQRFVRNLAKSIAMHEHSARCEGCDAGSCTEDSLFGCFMTRYVGLHDFRGARALCLDGMTLFPSSARFSFFYAVLLQVLCEDLGVAMAFLNRALRVLQFSDDELATCENQYLLPALQLYPNDVAVYLDLAVVCQCSENTTRAESHYTKALSLPPPDYAIPGYLHRVQTLDRLLFNYHRFCSIFNSRQTNILAKAIPVAKRGEQIRCMVAKMHQYTVVYPADPENTNRVNAIYLSDDEVCAFLSEHGKAVAMEKPSPSELAEKEVGAALQPNRSLRSVSSWRNSSQKASMRQKTMRNILKETSATDSPLATSQLAKSIQLVQLHQSEFRGLNMRPTKFSALSEKRSKLTVSRDHAEVILKNLVFINPAAAAASQANERAPKTAELEAALPRLVPQGVLLTYVMVLPSLLKLQQQRSAAVALSLATVDVQRVFRGFQFRSQLRREKLIQSIQQRQVDHMLAQLQASFVVRERRRKSAIAIQRIFKGFAHRNLLRRWHVDATHIQRVFRGYRGRKRALAFRDGNCTFYMTERVFQRGVEISGRRIMLSIEKCGLSFRFDGYDLSECVTFPGFFSHESALALLCHLNWTHAETFVGKECTFQATKLVINSVGFVNRTTAECFMKCTPMKDEAAASRQDSQETVVPLTDCVHSINLRELSTLGKNAKAAELPMTVDDTARLVKAMTERLALVHSIPMATKELKKKTPASYLITVMPPPRRHMLFKTTNIDPERLLGVANRDKRGSKGRTAVNVNVQDPEQIKFPVTDGLCGVSIGQTRFRKKCGRHAVHFTRCRCVLPITSTPAHIEALTLALTPAHVLSSSAAHSTAVTRVRKHAES